jgi:hypothetical protein
MSATVDPIVALEAQTKLKNLALNADLKDLDATLPVFEAKAPELKQITTPDELKTLIAAVQRGTADNEQLAKFIDIANRLLKKL